MAIPQAVELGVLLGLEIFKYVNKERDLQALAAKAGMSPEALDAAVAKAREELRSFDPSKFEEAK